MPGRGLLETASISTRSDRAMHERLAGSSVFSYICSFKCCGCLAGYGQQLGHPLFALRHVAARSTNSSRPCHPPRREAVRSSSRCTRTCPSNQGIVTSAARRSSRAAWVKRSGKRSSPDTLKAPRLGNTLEPPLAHGSGLVEEALHRADGTRIATLDAEHLM